MPHAEIYHQHSRALGLELRGISVHSETAMPRQINQPKHANWFPAIRDEKSLFALIFDTRTCATANASHPTQRIVEQIRVFFLLWRTPRTSANKTIFWAGSRATLKINKSKIKIWMPTKSTANERKKRKIRVYFEWNRWVSYEKIHTVDDDEKIHVCYMYIWTKIWQPVANNSQLQQKIFCLSWVE